MTSLPSTTNHGLWRLCAWAGPVFLVGYLVSWGLMGMNVPPLSAGIGLAELHRHYVDNAIQLRAAYVLSVFFIPFYMVFSSVVACVMRRVEGQGGPLSVVEQMGGALTVVVGMVSGICWLAAAYRPEERTAEVVRALHDAAWLMFDTTYMVTGLQMLAMATVFLSDRRAQPLIPRAMCWYTVFVVLAFLPLSLLPFFYEGPFAWSGVVCYWVSLGSWFVWLLALCVCLFKAIARLEHEDSGLVRTAAPALNPTAAAVTP